MKKRFTATNNRIVQWCRICSGKISVVIGAKAPAILIFFIGIAKNGIIITPIASMAAK
jgi:hypothetical protein